MSSTNGQKEKKSYHTKATGKALETAENHQAEQSLKLYGSCFCPFVQRVWVALEKKGISYQYVEIDPYAKPKALLDINPRGLVPALRHGDWGSYESTVLMEYLEDLKEGSSLLPSDPKLRAHSRLWSDHVNRHIIPAFYHTLQAQESSKQISNASSLKDHIATLVSAADPEGPFFLGRDLSFVDIQIAPWVIRLRRVLKPYRGWPDPEPGTRWEKWVSAIEKNESVAATTSDDVLYLESYERYAENRPNTSQLANADSNISPRYQHGGINATNQPLRAVQVEALVVMRMIKHCSQSFPTIATGSLVGLDVNGVLQITNCFPFPTIDPSTVDAREESIQNMAAAAPRAKSNTAYQNEMIKYLREVNVDANNVGWYTSTSMGNFITANTIENQFFYQKELNERTVALVYDVSRSVQGSLSLRAFRLSPLFMTAFKENKFTTESLQKSGLRHQDIFLELPVTVHNSHLLTNFLHELPSAPQTKTPSFPPSLASLTSATTKSPDLPLNPNFDNLELSIDPFLEKTTDLLLDALETHHIETNNAQYYSRSLAREQAKIAAWQAKRKSENAARVAAKQAPLPEDEWMRLFKLPTEPSRLDILLASAQVDQYAKQVDGFAGTVSGKMFAVKNNLIKED